MNRYNRQASANIKRLSLLSSDNEQGEHRRNQFIGTLRSVFKFLPDKYAPYNGNDRCRIAKSIRDSRISGSSPHKTNHHATHPDKTSQHACEMSLDITGKVIFHSHHPTFLQDLATMDWSSIKYAFLGGVVWNFGNIFLTAAIAVAGMSVGFPIGGGLAWIGGIVFNYLLISLAGQTYKGNQLLLWSGVLNIIVAILICGKAYGKLSSGKAATPKKGILLAIMAGIAIMFFYGLVVKSLDPQYVAGGTGTLTPYTGVFFFAVGILAKEINK